MYKNKSVSIILPAYNEELSISNFILEVKKLNIVDQIIAVNNNSTDNTEYEIKKNNVTYLNATKQGFGAAVKEGLYFSNTDLILICEPDADVVYGSRFLGGGRYARLHFFWHYLANKLLTFFCNFVTNINMTDMETGFKAFKKSCLDNINLEEKSFGFEPEITIKLAKKKLKFYEVSISYNGRTYLEGKKIGIKDAFRAFYCIIKYSIIK